MIWIILGSIPLIAGLVRLAYADGWLHILGGLVATLACLTSIFYGIGQLVS